ncbi:MAG: sensor histidine kinase, partial [Clostridium butyricum]
MKENIKKLLDSTTLFVRVASIMLITIILISISISAITIRISKNTIASTFSKSNYKVLSQIAENFNDLNSKIITAMNIVAD